MLIIQKGKKLFYELISSFSSLPDPLDSTEGAFLISDNNHSDDLFIYVKRKLSDLAPSSPYKIDFNIQIASAYPENTVGIEGSPGASVYVKAGATHIDPLAILPPDQQFLIMNIDKGNQSQRGKDMDVLGTVGISGDEFIYQLITRENEEVFEAETNQQGELWVIVGFDSGFEGISSLYFDKIEVKLRPES